MSDSSPQWMKSDGVETWHEIETGTLMRGLCGETVRGVVHQRRHVPPDGELCPDCVAVRGVVDVLPRDLWSGVWATELARSEHAVSAPVPKCVQEAA